jgi:16S rRNA (guanine966-N2)-methyltransferase
MRVIAGQWRGRQLQAPPGETTRPTADRLRQALFDILIHAPWCGRDGVAGAAVLDVFAGTGAMGLEALSRGAAQATFIEKDRAALAALRTNIAACRAEAITRVLATDATKPPAAPPGRPCSLVFLDPPYGRDLIPAAWSALDAAGWIAAGAVVIAETARDEQLEVSGDLLAERSHGAGRLSIWRHGGRAGRPDDKTL